MITFLVHRLLSLFVNYMNRGSPHGKGLGPIERYIPVIIIQSLSIAFLLAKVPDDA